MSSSFGSGELAALIGELGDANSSVREQAAEELFRRGHEIARPIVESWLAEAELAGRFVLDDSYEPAMTVGVAVSPPNFARIRAANESPRLASVPPDQDAQEFELHFPKGVRLDILTPKNPGGSGAIARYLQKFSEGIQQIEFLTRDVDRATEILRSRFGVQPIYPAARPGADGTRVNFFLVSLPEKGPEKRPEKGKTLIELVEPAAPSG
jgi:hypothetical protein